MPLRHVDVFSLPMLDHIAMNEYRSLVESFPPRPIRDEKQLSEPWVVLPLVLVVLMMGKHLSDKNNSESVFHSGHKPELVPGYVEDRQTTHTLCAGKGRFELRPRSPVRVPRELAGSSAPSIVSRLFKLSSSVRANGDRRPARQER